MTAHTNDHGSSELPERVAPHPTALAGLPTSALLPYWEQLLLEICYVCQVGHPDMDGAASAAFLDDLEHQIENLNRDLIRRASHEQSLAEPEEAETASQRQSRSVDLIRARLDLPTFIARHIGRTPVAFRRVGGMLVCPCPLPEETNDDAWLCVDPVAQIWKCTGCRDGGDVSAFAHSYFGLQGRALWAFLGREAGLTFDPWPTHD